MSKATRASTATRSGLARASPRQHCRARCPSASPSMRSAARRRMRSGALRFAAAAGAASLAATGGLAAADGDTHAGVIQFVNDTPSRVMFIYAHMDDVTDLEDDLLGNDVLE